MKRLVSILAASALVAGAMTAVPVLADTGSGTTGLAHAIDCFGLLFSDPAKHAQECGGPNFVPPLPPTSGGDGTCLRRADIEPLDPTTGQPVKSDVDDLAEASSVPCNEL